MHRGLKMRILIYIFISVLISSCASSNKTDNHTSLPPKVDFNENISQDNVLVSVNNYDLNHPREEEKTHLKKVFSMISQTLNLLSNAQANANYNARVVFDYDTMILDLQAIHFGLNQYFLTNIRSPRIPDQINEYPIKGSYIKMKH